MYPEVISTDFGLFSPVFSTDSPTFTEQLHGLTEFEELPKDIFLSNEAEEIAEMDTKEALKPLLPVHNAGDDGDGDGDGDDGDDGVKEMEMEMMDAYVSNMTMGLITTYMGHGDGDGDGDAKNHVHNIGSGDPTSINGSMPSPPHLAGHQSLPPLSPRFIPSSSGAIPSPNPAKPVAAPILDAFCPANTSMMPIPPAAHHCTDKNPPLVADISFADYDACRTASSPICCAPTMMMMMQRRSHSSHDLGRLMGASFRSPNRHDDHNWVDASSMSTPTPYIMHGLNLNAMSTLHSLVGRNLLDSDPDPSPGAVGPASRSPSERNQAPWSNDSLSDRLIARSGGVPSMRRAHSAGDIEAVLWAHLYGGRGNSALPMERGNCSPTTTRITEDFSVTMGPRNAGHCTQEERKEKLYRYRQKRNERNFTKKIKYACRKSLADSRPRIRGRFARTDEPEEEPTVSCCKKNAARGHVVLAEDCRNSCTSRHAGPRGLLSVSD